MNLLIDASLPPRIARALHQLASPVHHVAHVRDVLGNDATDRHIADYLRDHTDTALIGIDLDTSTQPHRLQALLAWGVPVMLLHEHWLSLTVWEQAWHLAVQWPSMLKKLSLQTSPSVYLVPRPNTGRIRKVS